MPAGSAADLQGIAAFIGQDRPGAARRVLQSLRETFRCIAENPYIGTCCDEIGAGLRYITAKAPAKRYVILFRPTETVGVEIFAVVDGARDWQTLLSGR